MHAYEQLEEKVLIERMANDDQFAFSVIVKRYWNIIYSQSLAYVKSTYEAQDIVQEVFLKIWVKRKSLPLVDKFDAYVFVIARNHIISSFRKKLAQSTKQLNELELEECSVNPHNRLTAKELGKIVQQGIDLLPPQQKTAFLLSREEEMSYDAIAESMGLSRETVKKHIGRALNSLRTYVRNHTGLTLPLVLLHFL